MREGGWPTADPRECSQRGSCRSAGRHASKNGREVGRRRAKSGRRHRACTFHMGGPAITTVVCLGRLFLLLFAVSAPCAGKPGLCEPLLRRVGVTMPVEQNGRCPVPCLIARPIAGLPEARLGQEFLDRLFDLAQYRNRFRQRGGRSREGQRIADLGQCD